MSRPESVYAPPRVATTWVIGIVIFLVIVFVWLAVKIPETPIKFTTGSWPVYAVILFELCWLTLGLVCIWGFIVQLSTRFDVAGVSQLTIRGVIRILWKEVTDVSEKPMGTLVLSDPTTSITIASALYDNTCALDDWIQERLRQTRAPAVSGHG